MSGEGGDYRVVGGAGGLEADLDDMDDTGSRIRQTGWDLGDTAVSTHKFLLDADLLSSAMFSPGTFATFEGSLLGALDGPGGLSANAITMTSTGLFMQAKAKGYAATDRALEYVEDIRQHSQGMLYGASLLLNPLATVGVTAAVLAAQGAFDDPQKWLVEHPDVLEEIVASAPGLLDLLLPGSGFPADTADAAGLLALLYDQAAAPTTTNGPQDSLAAQNLGEAFDTLDELAAVEDGFAIEVVGEPPNQVYNIYLPGTKVFDSPIDPGVPGVPDSLTESDLVQNLGTNFAGIAGDTNAYEQSILDAMEQAQIPADAPINFMGHSQGGIVAARMAEKLSDPDSGYRQYNVTSVVTAGSPVDAIDLPERIKEISLVNEYDIVPRLDGENYDDRSNHTTIVTEVQNGTVTANHSLSEVYLPMAHDLSAQRDAPDADPGITAALDGLDPFLGNGTSQTWTFHMTRK